MYTVLNKYRKQIDKKKNEDDKAGSIFHIFFIFLFSRLTRNNNTHKNFKKEKQHKRDGLFLFEQTTPAITIHDLAEKQRRKSNK